MTLNENGSNGESNSKRQTLYLGLMLLLACSFGIYASISVFLDEIANISKIYSSNIYIGKRELAFGIIFIIPTISIFIYMVFLILLHNFKPVVLKLLLQTTVFSLILMVLSSICYGFWIESALREHGYTHCYWYDSAVRGSPTIWVESERFCQKRASNMTIKLFEYFNEQDALNKKPTDKELNAVIQNIVENSIFSTFEND
jgi:hypothetical protein